MPEKTSPNTEPKKIERSRKIAEIVLEHPEFKYSDIEAPTSQETREKFNRRALEIFSKIEVVVHGMEARDRETGEQRLAQRGDMDGEAALGLLRMALKQAGLKIKEVTYVQKGATGLGGKMLIDTGGKNGIVIEKNKDGTVTIYFDHHSPEFSTEPTSATQLMYEGLTASDLLQEEPYLNNLVEFVTQADNLTWPDSYYEKYQDYDKMLVGLWNHVQFAHLEQFFKDGKSPTDILTPEEIAKYNLQKSSEAQKLKIKKSLEVLPDLEKAGFVVETEKYGKILIDFGRRLPNGTIAAKYRGYDGYISWHPNDTGFFITVPGKDIAEDFGQGVKVRGSMHLKNPKYDPSPRTLTLTEVLNKMSGGKLKPKGLLKKYLDFEKKNVYNKDTVVEPRPTTSELPPSEVIENLLDELDDLLASQKSTLPEYDEALEVIREAEDLSLSDPLVALEHLHNSEFLDDVFSEDMYDKALGAIKARQGTPAAAAPTMPTPPPIEGVTTPPTPPAPQPVEQAPTITPGTEANIDFVAARIDQINKEIADLNKDLSEKVLRWSETQEKKKKREELWEEKGGLLGHPLEEWEKWSEEQVDRFIKTQEGPQDRKALSGDFKEPGPALKPLGIEKSYWEDVKNKMSRSGQPLEASENQGEELESARQEIRNTDYALFQKREYLTEVDKMIAHAKTTGRGAPGIGPEGLAYWENEAKKTKREIKKLEKELESLWSKIPQNDSLRTEVLPTQVPPIPEDPLAQEPSPKPSPDVLGEQQIRPEGSAPPEPLPITAGELREMKKEQKDKQENRKGFRDLARGFFNKFKKEEVPPPVSPEAGPTLKDRANVAMIVRSNQLNGWFKERVKSLFIPVGKKDIPIPTIIGGETQQAEMLRQGTKQAAHTAEAYSDLIKKEITINDTEEINKELREIEKRTGRTLIPLEYGPAFQASLEVRVQENDSYIETIVAETLNKLRDSLAKARGQATSENVLTQARQEEIGNDLRTRLQDLRKNRVAIDAKSFTKLMREVLDRRYYLRYFYDISKVLAFLGIAFYRSMGDGSVPQPGMPGPEAGLPPAPIGESPDIQMRWMDDHLWQEATEILNEEGVTNPTNGQIQAVDNALSVANNVKVIDPSTGQAIWPDTINGEVIDRIMQAGPVDATEAVKLARDIASGNVIIN